MWISPPPAAQCAAPFNLNFALWPVRQRPHPAMTAAPPIAQALVFDIFGTVVDWRSSVIREGQIFQQRLNLPRPRL